MARPKTLIEDREPITVRLDPPTLKWLRLTALSEGVTVSEKLNQILAKEQLSNPVVRKSA